LNDRVIPFFDSHDIRLLRDIDLRKTERHEYERYLAVETSITRAPNQEPADQRHLRTFPQNGAERVLPFRVPQKGVCPLADRARVELSFG
jgi:hypothetical protein